jgi:MFS family permease
VPNVIGILLSGVLVGKFGHYMPFFVGCVVLTSIGSALITLFRVDTSVGQWIGYQILYGFGNGIAFTLPQIVAQAVLTRGDIPVCIPLL